MNHGEQELISNMARTLAQGYSELLEDCTPKFAASLGVEMSKVLLPVIKKTVRENPSLTKILSKPCSDN